LKKHEKGAEYREIPDTPLVPPPSIEEIEPTEKKKNFGKFLLEKT